MYFFQHCYPDAANLNQELHSQVLDLIQQWRGPSFVAADFNCDITLTHTFQGLYAPLGFEDVRNLHNRHADEPLPPTTNGSTNTDTVLVSPWLCRRFISAFVREDSALATHSPVHSYFRVHGVVEPRWDWKLPRNLHCEQLSSEHVDFHAKQTQDESRHNIQKLLDSPDTPADDIFLQWSKDCEEIFQRAIASQNQIDPVKWPKAKLPPKYWGRGSQPRLINKPAVTLVKHARHGDYQPNHDTTSLLSKQRVKQTRRIQSLLNRFRYQERQGINIENHQNIQEWDAICSAVGYGNRFSQWILTQTDLNAFPEDFPTGDQLHQIYVYVKADADRVCSSEAQHRKAQFRKFLKDDWIKRGGKATYSCMSSKMPAHFSAMMVPCNIKVTKGRWIQKGILQYIIDRDAQLRVGDKLQIDGESFDVIARFPTTCHVRAKHLPDCFFPKEATLLAQCWVYTSNEMMHGFFRYWSKYWERDPVTTDDQYWNDAMRTLEAIPQQTTKQITLTADDLKLAIKHTPSHSARGLCGWNIKELKCLPESTIQLLVVIANHFIDHQWPELLGWVRLALPPKNNAPTKPQDGRPICIMSQVYRVIAKSLAQHVLQNLADILPPQITGGVPGRSASQVWYAIQAQVEKARFSKTQLYGFCLDIQKAFNAVPRWVAKAALIRAGVPVRIAEAWFRLLQSMKRSVKIAGSSSPLWSSSTGIPEGDPISVPCMAIICWIFHQVAQRGGSSPWAYADNWEFLACSISSIADSIRETQSLLQAWKLELDVQKSWMWSVFPLNAAQTREIHAIFPETKISLVPSAKDLGATMRYRKVQCIQHSKKRFDEAILRTRRLMMLPGTLSEKWRAIMGSAVNTALYAIEIVPLGYDHFKLLRSAMANVICQTWKQRNEFLTCCFTHHTIADPEVLTIKRCIRLCRQFLHNYPEMQSFLQTILHEAVTDTKHIHGPFGCLKRWLCKLGWKFTPTGNVIDSDGLVFSVMYTCPTTIDLMIDRAWETIVLDEISHRKGMNDIPSANSSATVALLQKLEPTSQNIMVKYLTGMLTFGDAAKHWGSGDGSCPYCLADEDSQRHRVMDCPAFASIRSKYSDTFDWFQQECPFWPNLPVITRTQEERILRQWTSTHPIHVEVPTHHGQSNDFAIVFTDGSCIHPTQCECSVATWAVVIDKAKPHEHCAAVQLYIYQNIIAPTFCIHDSGFVQGRQSNDRAELTAILMAVSSFYYIEIRSDSEYAIGATNNILDGAEVRHLLLRVNSDLLLELHRVLFGRDRSHVRLCHTRAHRDIHAIEDVHEAHSALGNHVADRAAAAVWRERAGSQTKEIVRTIHEHYGTQTKRWNQFSQYLVEQTKMISDWKHPTTSTSEGHFEGYDATFHKLLHWSPGCATMSFDTGLTDEQAVCFPHPAYFVLAVSQWLACLRWPTCVQPDDPGITWLELLVDCISSTGVQIPKQLGKYRAYQLYDGSATALGADPLNTQVVTFRSCVKLIGTFLNKPVFPTDRGENLCKALQFMPGNKPSTGIRGRPILVSQHKAMHSLRKFFGDGAYKGSSTTWVDVFPFDRVSPCMLQHTLSIPEPCCTQRISKFIKVQLSHKGK
eukprot:Skav203293  [mRNA]  locus=scaffold5484:137994:142763:+ [translate_table: standard]